MEQDDAVLEQAQELFREAQDQIYNGGSFDAMADQVEDTGEFAPAVSQLASSALLSVVNDAQVTDVAVLFSLGIILISDLFDGLQKVGLESDAEAFNETINQTMQLVINGNPEFAKMVQEDPDMQEAMANPEALKAKMEATLGEGGEVSQGVLEGAEQAQMGGM